MTQSTETSDHVAWCQYVRKPERPTAIRLCDSNAEGAFPVFRHSQWVSVADRLPSHQTVVVWVVGGRLATGPDDAYMDVGYYSASKQEWRVSAGSEDETVQVSHWLDPERPDNPVEPDECRTCMGMGHFKKDGEPSIDRRDRKCLDCRGSGKVG